MSDQDVTNKRTIELRVEIEYELIEGMMDSRRSIAESLAAMLDGECAISSFKTDNGNYAVNSWSSEAYVPSLRELRESKEVV